MPQFRKARRLRHDQEFSILLPAHQEMVDEVIDELLGNFTEYFLQPNKKVIKKDYSSHKLDFIYMYMQGGPCMIYI